MPSRTQSPERCALFPRLGQTELQNQANETNFLRKSMTFLKNIVYYYVGFKLKLNTGEIGEILYVSPLNNYQPLIKVEDKVIDLSLDKRYSILEMV